MELGHELAQSIVDKMMKQLPFNINMMDENGYIIASGDPDRINSLHVGALDAIKQRKTLTMSDSYGENGQPGVNMPVFFENTIIGVIGITGDPDTVLPFASLLRTATELLIAQSHANQIEKENENRLNRFLFQWAQVTDNIEQHTDLILDAKELHIDIFKERIAIAINVKNSNHVNFPLEMDDYLITLSTSRVVILTTYLETIKRCLKICKHKKLDIGVGRKTNIVGTSINEALKTLEIANIFKDKNYLYFDQIEFIYSLLQSNLPVTDLVSKLDQLDQTAMGSDLINTLLEFIENNQNINQTAETLHIHRNTLNYRLNKIKDELELNPRKLIDLFQLYVAYLYFSEKKNKAR